MLSLLTVLCLFGAFSGSVSGLCLRVGYSSRLLLFKIPGLVLSPSLLVTLASTHTLLVGYPFCSLS